MMIRPAFLVIIPGRISFRNSTGALMCTAWAAHQRSGSISDRGPKGPGTPALLTSRVMGPSWLSAAITAWATSSRLVTSAGTAMALPPASVISDTARFS